MANKKIESSTLFDPNLFIKTKEDALAYLAVLKNINEEQKESLKISGKTVKDANKDTVAGLKQREAAIKSISNAEIALEKVEQQKITTEQKLLRLSGENLTNLEKEFKAEQQLIKALEQENKLANQKTIDKKRQAQEDKKLAIQNERLLQTQIRTNNLQLSTQKRVNSEREKAAKKIADESNAYKRLSNQVNAAQANFKRMAAQFGITSKQAKQAKIALDGVQKELMQIDSAARDGRRNVGRYGTAMQGLGKNLKAVGARFIAFTAILYGLGRAIVSSYKTFRDFQQGSANLAAVMGKTRKEVKALTDDAKRLGAATVFTASQVIELQVAYSKLGFKEDEILAATEATLALAAATGTDLNEAATVTAQTLNGFGLEADETNRVVDVMAKAFTESALDMQKFSVAMANVSTAAKIGGFSVERTTAALGLLVDRGIDASKAGTDLRKIFSSLAKDGLTFEDAMSKINNSTDKTVTAIDLFGERSFAAGVILAENNKDLAEFEAKLKSSGGAAKEMADTQLDTLSGATTRLSSAWEGFILSLEDGDGVIGRVFRGLIDYATKAVEIFTELARSERQSLENRLGINEQKGVDIALSKQKAILELQKMSTEELQKINDAQAENASLAGAIIRNRTDNLTALEQEVFLNAAIAVDSKSQLKNFDELAAKREKYISSNNKALLNDLGLEMELLEVDERRNKAQLVGLNSESKKLAIAALKKSTQEELLALIAKENQFNQTKGGQAAIYLAKQELQRRKDIGEQIDVNAEKEETGTKKNEKENKKVYDEKIERTDLLTKAVNEQLELERLINEELRISGGLETATTEKLRAQSAELQKQIDNRRDARSTQGPLTDVVGVDGDPLAKYEEYLKNKKDLEDKEAEAAEEAAKKEADLFNERLAAAEDFTNTMMELSNQRIDKQIENIDKELEATTTRQQELEALAAVGQLDAEQSIKSEIKRQDELERQKADLEARKQRREAISSGFSLLAANLEKGATGDDAVVQTFRQMTNLISLISNLPGFFVGTENAPEGYAWTDEKGAEIHMDKLGQIKDMGSNKGAQLKYLEAGDKILTAEKSAIVKRQMSSKTSGDSKNNSEQMTDARIVQAVQSVAQAVNDKPIQEFDYDKINEAVISSVKGNGELIRKHISNKPKF